MNTDERRAYVEAECEEAGLDEQQTALAVEAATSVGDELCDDDFEVMVASIIEGASESEQPDVTIDVSKLGDWRKP